MLEDGRTIFALASGQGRAAISVVRLSGPKAGGLLDSLTRAQRPPPRTASLRHLRHPTSGEVLDQAVCLWLPGPGTFTGEDQAELHLHGGLAVRSAVLRALGERPECRPAEPGEFTRRAFLNGKLDLTKVEGLADLIEAETEAQRRQALRQLEGELAARVASWRDRLVDALALCEAALDFSDEEDVPRGIADEVGQAADAVGREIGLALAGARQGERVREGLTVVLAGPPNSGKSTLLNALARREAAIVSPMPGTTRDAIEVRCDLDGLAVTFVDTAGLRETVDAVEAEGIARTKARIENADLVLWLTPADEPGASPPVERPPGSREVFTKLDLAGPDGVRPDALALSALTGEGVASLVADVTAFASGPDGGGDALLTRERHRQVLTEAEACLKRAMRVAANPDETELLAEELRLALRALGAMAGEVGVEDVLDRIFASFCIGK